MCKTTKNLWLIIVAVGFFCFISSRSIAQTKVAFLNTQNLFDTINNPDCNDGEFTPSGSRKWDSAKYFDKVTGLAEIVKQLDADILGLCEVENREVVADLVRASGGGYNIVHYESRDGRGIDICLLYRPDKCTVNSSEMILEHMAPRGVLKVQAEILGAKTFFYVAHLPSQRGGNAAHKRREEMIKALESEVGENIGGNVVVMGDMNTEPIILAGLTNLATPLAHNGLGSYCYGGLWTMLDQFLISPSLVHSCSNMELHIPKVRQHLGRKFQQPSDHYGIYIILKI